MKNTTVSKEQARAAVERLMQAVWKNSGISLRLSRFLVAAHHGNGEVDFSLFPSLDPGNLAAAETVMQYSIFAGRYKLPLEWEEFNALRDFYESRE